MNGILPCFLFCLVCLAVSCAITENELRRLAQSPSSAIAIKDAKGHYWGFKGSAVENVSGSTVILKMGEPIHYCTSAEGSEETVGRALLGDTLGTPAIEGSQMTWKTESVYGRLPIKAGPDESIQTTGRGVTGINGGDGSRFSLSGCVPG